MTRYLLASLLLYCIIGLAYPLDEDAAIGSALDEVGSQLSFANIFELAMENPLDEGNSSSQTLVFSEENASVFLMQMAPGASIELHYHQAHDELVYMISGVAISTVYAEEPEELHLQPGDMLYLPTGVRHAVRAVGDETVKSISIFIPHFDGRDRIFVSPSS